MHKLEIPLEQDSSYPNALSYDPNISLDWYFTSIIDAVESSLYWKSSKGIYLGCNNYAAKMINLKHPRDIIGKTDYDLFDGETATDFRQKDAAVITREEPLRWKESSIGPHGEKIVQITYKRPLYNRIGEIIGIMGNTMNLTEQTDIAQLPQEKARQENEQGKQNLLIKKQQAEIEFYKNLTEQEKLTNNLVNEFFHLIHAYQIKILHKRLGINPKALAIKPPNLTKREREVLFYLSLNKSPKEIANILSVIDKKIVAPSTVQSIIDKRLYSKLDSYNISQLIEKAYIFKLIPLLPD